MDDSQVVQAAMLDNLLVSLTLQLKRLFRWSNATSAYVGIKEEGALTILVLDTSWLQ